MSNTFSPPPAFRKISMTAMSKPSVLALNHVNASCSTAAKPTHPQVGRGSRGVSTAVGRPGLRHRLAAISALRSIARRALSVFYRSFALLLRSPAAMATPRHSPSEGAVERIGLRSSGLGQKRIHGVRGSGRIGLAERHSPDRATPKVFEFRRVATPASTQEASTMRLTKVRYSKQRSLPNASV